MTSLQDIQLFRSKLYSMFPSRRDAIMNLLDAISSYAHRCDSVVKLSEAKYFKRSYCSITDAIKAASKIEADGWHKMMTLAFTHMQPTKINRFVVDVTSNPRPYAKTLEDRVITHSPNPAPSNKPICVGHPYSVIVGLPDGVRAENKHWVKPLSAQRVKSDEKGHNIGMRQLVELIDKLGQSGKLNISFGDSLYGTPECRKTASEESNLVHIFRLRISRNIFLPATESSSGPGRKSEYGQKISLSDPGTHTACNEEAEWSWENTQGKTYTAKIKLWKDMLIRGTKDFKSSEHPINALQIIVTNEDGNEVFKRPLWLAVFGERRHEIEIKDAYSGYCSRYDIEHFFRFSKQKMLLDNHQTPEITNEEAWWKLNMLAYSQLYQGRELTQGMPYPWEKYLPSFKDQDENTIGTPAQTQRGFEKLLDQIGTPASPCKKRGNPQGRKSGTELVKRSKKPVIFKGSKKKSKENLIDSASEKTVKNSEPDKINILAGSVAEMLKKLNFSPQEFLKILEEVKK